ncbi:doublecortin like kinase 2 [Phyllostomus discolor]|uniref:Doublecortin like kinase 2 n=1 Tax=Phyllostomus discolor TaxID=89673 RepID=A0A833ZCI5_9CHIR|nr:doublecortin like kinase 2 [Phyllostomus discolor]
MAVLQSTRCKLGFLHSCRNHPLLSPLWSSSFQELISQMLQVNVEARCTAGEILSHPWVSDDASQENNMHAEVAGKLKQHFHNALPKHNSTTTGVSVIVNTALDKEGQIFGSKHGQDSGRAWVEPACPVPPCAEEAPESGAAASAPAPPQSPTPPCPPAATGCERAGTWRRHRD